MKFKSDVRVGLIALLSASLFFGCGVKPAPTEDQTAALLRGGTPLFVRECERLLKDCDRFYRPGRFRDACVRKVLRGECGHHEMDAGRDAAPPIKDAAVDVGSTRHDAAADRVDSHVDSGTPDLRTATVDGATDFCPIITQLSVSGATAVVGEPITVGATAVVGELITISVNAIDPDPSDKVSFAWGIVLGGAVGTGSFDPAISTTTGSGAFTFTCLSVGTVEIEVDAGDRRTVACDSVPTLLITCTCPDGGCPLPACLPDQASCNPLSGPSCCNSELCNLGRCGGCTGMGLPCGTGCCAGVACTNGFCGGCVADSITCTLAVGLPAVTCCSGVECGAEQVCGGPPCAAIGGACGGATNCCTPGVCQLTTELSGTCVTLPPPPPCVPDGQLCAPPQTCCTGKICFGVCGMLEGGP